MQAKRPDVVPQSCRQCDYFKPTGTFDRRLGDCAFYGQTTYANYACSAARPPVPRCPHCESSEISKCVNLVAAAFAVMAGVVLCGSIPFHSARVFDTAVTVSLFVVLALIANIAKSDQSWMKCRDCGERFRFSEALPVGELTVAEWRRPIVILCGAILTAVVAVAGILVLNIVQEAVRRGNTERKLEASDLGQTVPELPERMSLAPESEEGPETDPRD